MRFRLGPTVALFCLLAGLAVQAADYVDGVAAIVDTEVITFARVRKELAKLRSAAPEEFARIERQSGDLGCHRRALQVLVENELIFAEVRSRDVRIPRKYIDTEIDDIVRSDFGGDWNKFQGMLVAQGQDLDDFRKEIEKQLGARVLVEELVRRTVAVSPREVDEYYAGHQAEFFRPERVRLSLIFLPREGKTDADLEALEADLRQRLAKGEPFAALAKAFSKDATASEGGALGWQTLADLKPYAEALRDAKPGSLAPTVKDAQGYHLLYVHEREAGTQEPLNAAVRERIEQTLRIAKERERFARLITELRAKFYVRNFIEDAAQDMQKK